MVKNSEELILNAINKQFNNMEGLRIYSQHYVRYSVLAPADG
jgi:hypothetical protein